ncbi:MAG: hypothetical protein AAGO57_05685 [Pseudomonadota bacterium]
MSAAIANLLNAFVLLGMSLWGYFTALKASPTALIPAAAGILLLICAKGVKDENKMIAHIAVTITLVIFLALFVPFFSAVSDGDGLGIFRVGAMMLTSLIAMVFFIKGFIDARKAREAAGG